MKKILSILALMVVAMTAGAYNLTVGTNASGTIKFKVGGSEVTTANEGDEVTVVITPNSGYVIKEVTGLWYAAQAKIRRAELLKDFTITPADGVYKFTMRRANVEISATYTKDLATSSDITINVANVTYTGEAQTPEVVVKDGETTMTKDTDYTLAYSNNTSAGTATATVTGKGSYSGTKAVEFTISKAELTEVLLDKATLTYNKAEQTVTLKHVLAGELTVPAEGYNISGNKATNVGNYTLTVTGKGNFTGSVHGYYSIVEAGAHLFTLTLDETSVTYDGTEKKPAVTVKDEDHTLVLDTDYTLAYENNVNAGTGKVIATGKGNYSGTKTAEFIINKADITEITAPKGKTLFYTGAVQELIEAGTAAGGEMQYSLIKTSGYSTTIPKGTEVGDYKVYYIVKGDANHNDVAIDSIMASISGFPLEIAAGEYGTFYYTDKVKCITEGVEIYAVTGVSDNTTQIEKIEGVVPAEMPILVKNATEAAMTVLMIPTIEEVTTTVKAGTELKGTAEAIEMEASTDEKSYYVCNGKEFIRVEESGMQAARQCWLEITTSTQAAARRSISIGGETTGVNETLRMKNEESSWYDMSGRKLSGKPSAKGVYIQNGRKIVVK